MGRVLVTGGSGFVGSRVLLNLLSEGYQVCATVRSKDREGALRSLLKEGGAVRTDLECFAADLGADAGWAEAAKGCDYVLHVASPFPLGTPKHEDELIVPAREGALRVLRAARDAGVKRVVMTSSFAAVGYGHKPRKAPFDEADWTDTAGTDVQPYIKSKTLAERAAWEFMFREGGALELAVINPVGIFGPVLGPDLAGSADIIRRMLDGAVPACPRIYFGAVDVRDVADLHVLAMTHPAAKGERFLAAAGDSLSMLDVAKALGARFPGAKRLPRRQLPDWMVRLAAWRDPALRRVVPQLGKIRNASPAKAKLLLGWSPRSGEEAVCATAESLMRLGILKEGDFS